MPGKVYGRILNERIKKITERSISPEQGYRESRGCGDQIFILRMIVKNTWRKTGRCSEESVVCPQDIWCGWMFA